MVPPPERLAADMITVFCWFNVIDYSVTDASGSHHPFFNSTRKKKLGNALKYVYKGLVSDSPHVCPNVHGHFEA
jgi:hypothetical protein